MSTRYRIVVAVTVLAMAAAATAGQAGVRSSRFFSTRVCPYPQFSQALARCTSDWRATAFRSSRFTCSTDLAAPLGTVVYFRATYNGAPAGSWEPLTDNYPLTRFWFWRNVIPPTLPLPGGTWTCDLRAGKTETSITFQTTGPTGDVVDFAACDSSDTTGDPANGECKSDESAGVAETGDIVLSLEVLNHIGAKTTLELVDPTGAVVRSAPVERPLSFAMNRVWWHAIFPTNMMAGTWECRVLLDGTQVALEPFTITP